MRGSTVSRRVSEFIGVALFAGSLIWLISLASYEPGDAVWFFSTGSHTAPANFAGPRVTGQEHTRRRPTIGEGVSHDGHRRTRSDGRRHALTEQSIRRGIRP